MTSPLQIGSWELPTRVGVEAFEERVFRAFVLFATVLEIVVFHEPAPVDAAIVFCLALGLLLGKLRFDGINGMAIGSLAVFALANLLSMYDPFDSMRAVWYIFVTLYLVASWFFFVGVIGYYGSRFMASLINAYCLAGLISAGLGIVGYFHLVPHSDLLLLNGRAKGLFKDCNVYGPFFVPMALYALSSLMDPDSTGRRKAPAALYFLAAATAMLLSFSRACWLNFGVSLVVFFLLQLAPTNVGARARPRLGGAIAIVAAGAALTIVLISTSAVKDMLDQRVTDTGLQGYDRVRFATQALALDVAEERPLGIGPGQSELVFGYATHSMYMRILSENGLLALIAMMVFIGATMARAWSVATRTPDGWLRTVNLIVLACILGHLANSVVIDTVHWRHIWFIYALPWAVSLPVEYRNRFGGRGSRERQLLARHLR